MKTVFIFAALLSSSLSLAQSPAPAPAADAAVAAGIYSGTITMFPDPGKKFAGSQVTIDMGFQYTGKLIDGDSDDSFRKKLEMIGAFVLDGEGGPYNFTLVDYNFDTGKFDVEYSRQTSSGGASTTVGLRFLGRYGADGTFAGDVTSGPGLRVGTFSVKRQSTGSPYLTVTPKYIGVWTGQLKGRDGDVNAFSISLDSTNGTSPNPDYFELAFTPGRAGDAEFLPTRSPLFGFSSVVIDYLRKKIDMYYVVTGINTSGVTVDFSADIKEGGDTLEGATHSTNSGSSATFVVHRGKK